MLPHLPTCDADDATCSDVLKSGVASEPPALYQTRSISNVKGCVSHSNRCLKRWCRGTELNRRRQPFQGCALPPELPRHAWNRAGPGRVVAHRCERLPAVRRKSVTTFSDGFHSLSRKSRWTESTSGKAQADCYCPAQSSGGNSMPQKVRASTHSTPICRSAGLPASPTHTT